LITGDKGTLLATSPAWIIGGLLLWRRAPLGYVTGLCCSSA
jgi:hypothetical protein